MANSDARDPGSGWWYCFCIQEIFSINWLLDDGWLKCIPALPWARGVLTEFETCRVFFHKQALQPQICFDFRPKHDHFLAGTAYSRNLNPAYHDHKISNFADMDSLLLYQESRYSNWVEMIGGFIGIVRDQFVENIPDKIWLFEYLRTELM